MLEINNNNNKKFPVKMCLSLEMHCSSRAELLNSTCDILMKISQCEVIM